MPPVPDLPWPNDLFASCKVGQSEDRRSVTCQSVGQPRVGTMVENATSAVLLAFSLSLSRQQAMPVQ
jgi:hypothetical protein